jgi:hypothetical protein
LVQRGVTEEKEKKIFQTKKVVGQSSDATRHLESQIHFIKGGGHPLSESVRAFFEPRFGYNFSHVRVHNDSFSAQLAKALNAQALTLESNIIFGIGKSPGKDMLTAHELTHVLQQSGGGGSTDGLLTMLSFFVQRQCEGDVGSPGSYASEAAQNLRCDEDNTGIPDVTNRITGGRHRARVMVNDALAVLIQMRTGSASADALNQFRRLFNLGSTGPSSSQIRQAIRVYNNICSWLTSRIARRGGGILCLTQNSGRCRSGRILGTATCGSSIPINLCPSGISSDSEVTAQTIIHEVAHRFRICPPPQVRERYEGEQGFPTSPALTTSADSYSAFAREAHRLMGSLRLQESEGGFEERPITLPEHFR